MFNNYLIIAWRSVIKNKTFSFINIFGLATGLTACVLILMYVMDESSYDRHHLEGDSIYRIASETKSEIWVGTPAPLADGLRRELPEVAQVTRLLRFPGVDKMVFKNEETQVSFFERNCYYVDSTFFKVFTYDLKYGDIHTAFDQPNSIVLSESVAEKLFGKTDPVGHKLKVGLSFGDFDYIVKGVLKNSKAKSHIPVNVLLSMNNGDIGGWGRGQTNWATNSIFHTYLKVKPETERYPFEAKLQPFFEKNGGADFKKAAFTKTIFLQPLRDIYLHSNYGFELAPNGNIKYLYVFASIAIFLLLIACINYMNLSTARSEKRANEVGIRKVVGAVRTNLIGQFLSESIITSTLALGLTGLMIQLLLPYFNHLTNKELSLLDDHRILWLVPGLTLITGLMAGLYPSLYFSSFKPLTILKGKINHNFSVVTVRKSLIVFQFVVSTVLILSVVSINRQMNYLSNFNLGFNKSQKMILPIQTIEAQRNYSALKNELSGHPGVNQSGKGTTYPGKEYLYSMLFYAEGKTQNEHVDILAVNTEEGYFESLGFEMVHGRNFVPGAKADSQAIVLNETAVRQLGYPTDQAIGKKIYYEFLGEKYSMDIIGIMKDYHFNSLKEIIKPLAFSISPLFGSPNSYMIMDIDPGDYSSFIGQVSAIWTKINPNSPFEYSFLDQDFQKHYEKESRSMKIVQAFTILGILIACLGLYGLTAFSTERKIKEIGVRKVLGASVFRIVGLLSREIIGLVGLAVLIAFPTGYFIVNKWLQGFAYRQPVEWWLFIVVGLTALLVALLTISFQTIRAATTNPVNSLRSE